MVLNFSKIKRSKKGFLFLLNILLVFFSFMNSTAIFERKTIIKEECAKIIQKIKKKFLTHKKSPNDLSSKVFYPVKIKKFFMMFKKISKDIGNETILRSRHAINDHCPNADFQMKELEKKLFKYNNIGGQVERVLNPLFFNDLMDFLHSARVQEFRLRDSNTHEPTDNIESLMKKVYYDFVFSITIFTFKNISNIDTTTIENYKVAQNIMKNLTLLEKLCPLEENKYEIIHIVQIISSTISVLSLEICEENSFLYKFYDENKIAFEIAFNVMNSLLLKKIQKNGFMFYNKKVLESKMEIAKKNNRQEIYVNILFIVVSANEFKTCNFRDISNLSIYDVKKKLLNELKKNIKRACNNLRKNQNIQNFKKYICFELKDTILNKFQKYFKGINEINQESNVSVSMLLKIVCEILDIKFFIFLKIDFHTKLDLEE